MMSETIRAFVAHPAPTPRFLWLPKYVCTSRNHDVQTQLQRYLESHSKDSGQNLKCMYLSPKRIRSRTVTYPDSQWMTYDSLQHFCRTYLLNESPSQKYDMIVLDDFEMESLEKYILMMAFVKGFLPTKRMILIASHHDISDHMTTINSYIGCTYDVKECMDFSLEITNGLLAHDNGYVDVEFFDMLRNEEGDVLWEFDPATFVTPTDMCNVVQSILMEHVPSVDRRTLIFVQSADICEYIRDTIHLYSSLSAVTLHGQKSHQEMDEILTHEFDVMIATNILESGDRMFPHVHMVIDFGLCYAINTYGFLSLRYASRMEMNQRSKYVVRSSVDDTHESKHIVRIMSEDFFHTLPYMELATFDWKHFLMEQILNDKIATFRKILHEHTKTSLVDTSMHRYETPIQKDIYRDVLDLVGYHLIDHEFNLTPTANMYSHIFQHLSRTPFHTKHYAVIAHFHHMTCTDSVPMVIQILVSLTMAIVDTVHRYGQYKLFYFPLRHNRSPNQMFNAWMRVMYKMSGLEDSNRQHFIFHDHNFLTIILQLILTVIMSADPYETIREFHINTRVFRQLLYRWKILCGRDMLNIFGYAFPITDRTFMQYIKRAMEPFVLHKKWQLHPRDHFHYLIPYRPRTSNRKERRRVEWIHGQWCAMPPIIMDKYIDRMWRLVDFANWTQCICPYDRRLYFDHEMDDPYITIDAEHSIYLPMPEHVQNHVRHLRRSVENGVIAHQIRVAERLAYRTEFDKCIDEIQGEVAYRPGMAMYMECEDRFYQNVGLIINQKN